MPECIGIGGEFIGRHRARAGARPRCLIITARIIDIIKSVGQGTVTNQNIILAVITDIKQARIAMIHRR